MPSTETQQEKKAVKAMHDDLLVRARHFSKSFGKVTVLRDISLDLHDQENLVILGKSGTGKSVLIKSMVGLIRPDGGELNVLGHDLRSIENDELIALRRKIGYLFQGGALYDSMTVRENMRFPLDRQVEKKDEDEIEALVVEGLRGVGLENAIDKMPSELSGGMKKRIALARTLILRPKIMLYDEPTTGLDPVTSREISQLMLDMREKYGISSIIVTHDMENAKLTADKLLILRDGTFTAEGSYDALAASDDDWIRAFFNNS